jgi:hypothetical protein
MSEGLLTEILKQMSVMGIKPSKPDTPNEIKLEWGKEEFKKFLLANVDVNVQRFIDVDIQTGLIIIKIKLM